MVRPSHYISNPVATNLCVNLACAASLVVSFGAISAPGDGPGGDAGVAREPAATVPSNALISPDGKRSVWVMKDGAGFWYAERGAGGAWSIPAPIVMRGVVRSPAFSPDGSKLVFENARGGYSTQDPNIWGAVRAYSWGFMAIFDFNDKRITYVNPSFAGDRDPHWSSTDAISYTRHIEGAPDAILTSMIPGAQPRPGSAPRNKALLEALLATPLVYQPVAAGDGRSLAFVARAARERAIYFLRVGESTKSLVRYPDDDGQDLTQVALSPDGSLLSFVRGGPPNSKGEIPNPRSLSPPPLRQVWLLDTAGGAAPRPVGIGYAPQFSPDGARLIWLTERGVASVLLRSGDVRRGEAGAAEILLAGPLLALCFSPDGSKVAYQRSSYVEVLDLKSRAGWAVAKPADAVDVDPVWSPDGESIALRRLVGPQPYVENGYAGEYVAKEPWAIQVASVATHQVREVWRADPGMGSAYYDLDQDPTDTGAQVRQLFWSDGNDIAFTWERDGWRHLYAVSAQGGQPRLLTPGEGEVETAALSLDRKTLVYSTNIGDPYRRHIAAVAFSGAAPKSITQGPTSQWTPVPLAAGIAYIDAGWAMPPAVALQDLNGTTRGAGGPAVPDAYPSSRMVKPQPVSFPGVDGQTAYGQLFVPAKPSGCGVVFVHGGITRQMLLGFHYMEAYSNLYELNQYFSTQGCTVLSVEYRSSIMRGYAFRNAPGWGNGGASEYKDVLGGANYLKSRGDLKIEKIGIYGLSWGGYLTAQALARNSDVFKVGFDMAGVHGFPGATFKYSPLAFVGQWQSPLYIAAGDDDRNVDFNQSIALLQALRGKTDTVEIAEKVIPNEIHDLSLTFEDLLDVYFEGSEFVLNHLPRTRAPGDK